MIEPPFAIGLEGLIPEEPTVESLEPLLALLYPCPACHGTGTVRMTFSPDGASDNYNFVRCGTCHGEPALFWGDGLEYYGHQGHLCHDAALGYSDEAVRDRIRGGTSLADAWPHGVKYYGFHCWKRRHAFRER